MSERMMTQDEYYDALADNPPPAPGYRWDADEGQDVLIVCPGCASDPCYCDTMFINPEEY